VARTTKKTLRKADVSAAFDGGLTEPYKQGVVDSLELYYACLPAPFWLQLETVVGLFLDLQQRRNHQLAIEERARWQRIAKLVNETGQELRLMRQKHPWANNRLFVSDVWALKKTAEAYVAYYADIAMAFRGRSNPYLWSLCMSLLDLWVWGLGREARLTEGLPSEPLMRFMRACANPLLAHPLNPHTIRGYVDEYNERPRRVTLPGLRPIFSTSAPTVTTARKI
jgi:hypothetical protein